jgi:ankyrin repeat protein
MRTGCRARCCTSRPTGPAISPNGAATVALLVEAGAEVNTRFRGPHAETPLHWAASSNDVEVLDALVDAGADIEAAGAVLGGGPPLADATGFGQWEAAYRLVERGANATLRERTGRVLMLKRPHRAPIGHTQQGALLRQKFVTKP